MTSGLLAESDAIDRFLDRLWGRTGLRLIFVLVAGGQTIGWTMAAIAEILVARYLGMPTSGVMSVLAWSAGILVASAVVTLTICARVARPLTTISANSSAAQQQRAETVTDPVLNACFAVLGLLVIPAHLVLFVLAFHPDIPTLVLLIIGGAELALVIAWLALMMVPSCGRVIRSRVQTVTGRKVPVLTKWKVRSRMVYAIAPPALAGSSLGMLLFVQPSVPPEQLLVRVLGMTAVILFFLSVGAPLFTRSVTLPLRELTAGTERLKRADFSTPVPELASDEFGVLARTLNEAMRGVAERRRLAIEVRESRARIVTASDESRRRIERDLHDGAQQYLVLMELKLGLLKRAAEDNPALRALADEMSADLAHALAELRDLAHGLYPAVLESDGLPAALRDAAQRSPLRAKVDSDGVGRLSSEIEAAVYFCCLEAMQNAAKHGGDGASLTVTLGRDDGRLTFAVSDDGVGYDAGTRGASHGLQNMADRIGALGGELTIESTPGTGTTVSGWVPMESP